MAGSSSSSTRRRGADKPPLIVCPDCGIRNVVELVSTMEWSRGKVFYTCPNHKRDGTGCSTWFWEDEYIGHLQEMAKGKKQSRSAVGGECRREVNQSKKIVQEENGAELNGLIGIAKELAWLLKTIVLILVIILFVLLMLLFVQMKN